jgi:hypothetical protein
VPAMPDITPAQIVSTILAVLGLLVTQGLVTNHTEKLIGGLASILVPVAWQIADAIIRHGRAKIAAAQIANGPTPIPIHPRKRDDVTPPDAG